LQVVIEDYIHREGGKIALILLTKLASLALALAAVVALLVIAFGR
jgi:succinate dehydrogenase / fumarate reductase membrane anchor subunit